MTSRDRPTPENGTHTGHEPPLPRESLGAALCHSSALTLWEQWFRSASPAQRQQLLEQSGTQGLLFGHQLPSPEPHPLPGPSSLLPDLLTGRSVRLEPVREQPVDLFDTALDVRQRQALARALASPDLSLLLGYPGCGKSRVAVELLRQALRRRWRTLFVAPSPAAVDCVLEQLPQGEALAVLRWHDEREPVASLPPLVASLTLAGRLRSFEEQTLPAARAAVDQAHQRLEASHALRASWDRLATLREEIRQWRTDQAAQGEALAHLETTMAAEVEHDSAWQACQQKTEEQVQAWSARCDTLQQTIDELSNEHSHCDALRDDLQPLAEARQSQRWWTGAFWRATVQGDPQPRLDALTHRCREIAQRLQASQEELEATRQQIAEAHAARTAEYQRLLQRCREQHQAQSAARAADLDRRSQTLARESAQLAEQLGIDDPWSSPAADSVPAQAHQSWQARLDADAVELARREDWLAALQQALPALPRDLLASARLIATTLASLPREPFPGAHQHHEFDLIVVEESHLLGDSDLLALARRGHRLVLIGEAGPELPMAPPPRRVDSRRSSLPTPPFVRLWRHLHPDPRRLPFRCQHQEGRLVLTLRSLTSEQAQSLQREPLFDSPEIEIGFVAGPDQEPLVAEVAFPASTAIDDAKAFVLRELQDLVVHANGLMPYWRETDDAWFVELSPRADRELDVPLLEGVTECVGHCPQRAARGQVGWLTTSFRFDRRAGWEREAAEHWLAERLGLRDTGRTAVLARGYRARPALGQFLSQLLHAGAVEPGSTQADEPASFRFIAVPTAGRPDHRRPVEPDARWTQSGVATLAPRMRTARGGAGLELDLAESRRTELLPADLHPLLPSSGVVNYQEACALVQTLEAMVADPAFRSDCLAWQTRHGAEPRSRFRGLAVAILSTFPTQVQLLRLLVQRSTALAASGIRVEVGTPREMAQREVFAALVSLTRSHANRAVPFSEHPRDLVLALTRAAGHLVVLGDPGTLNRRSQWFGVLDHLDDIAGPLEQALIGQLLLSLQGSEPPARAPRALESSIV